MRKRGRIVSSSLFLVVIAIALLSGQASGSSASPLTWSAPVLIDSALKDRPRAILPQGEGVSCASASLCVMVADRDIADSTDPAGGSAAWQAGRLSPHGGGFDEVSCPTDRLCVSTGNHAKCLHCRLLGTAMSSTDPAAGVTAWSARATIDPVGYIDDASCASVTLCVAVDDSGHVASTSDPAGGADTWSVTKRLSLHPRLDLASVSCPSPSRCLVGASDHRVASSKKPTGSAGAWRITDLKLPGHPPSYATPEVESLSCASVSLCVGLTDFGSWVISSTDAFSRSPHWKAVKVDNGEPTGISCPSVALCVAADSRGDILTSTNPTGGSAAWTLADSDPKGGIGGISCPDVNLCVAIDGRGYATVGTG